MHSNVRARSRNVGVHPPRWDGSKFENGAPDLKGLLQRELHLFELAVGLLGDFLDLGFDVLVRDLCGRRRVLGRLGEPRKAY